MIFWNNVNNLTRVYRDALPYHDLSAQMTSLEIKSSVRDVLSNCEVN